MNKLQLIEAILEKTDGQITKTDVTAVIDGALATIKETVATGDEVVITGFGKFVRSERSARKGRDPRTGKELDIPAKNIPAFKAGKEFKDAVNSPALADA